MPNHGGGGRKAKPRHLHVVQGTFRQDRHGAEAPPQTRALPVAPAHLHERAKELFADLVRIVDGMGMATADHVHNLGMAATSLWEWERHEDVLESLGWTYTTVNNAGSTMFRARPEVAMRDRAMRRAESLLARFGLSPADVGKVAASAPPPANPFADVG